MFILIHFVLDFIKPICLPLHGEKSLPGKQMVVAEWNRVDSGKIT